MKVWELMEKLSQCRAGADVVVCMESTLSVDVDDCEDDGEIVTIFGGDPRLVDSEGDESEPLSHWAEIARLNRPGEARK